jgi:hypothetical protein
MQSSGAVQRRQQAALKVHQRRRSEIAFSFVQKITGWKKREIGNWRRLASGPMVKALPAQADCR